MKKISVSNGVFTINAACPHNHEALSCGSWCARFNGPVSTGVDGAAAVWICKALTYVEIADEATKAAIVEYNQNPAFVAIKEAVERGDLR